MIRFALLILMTAGIFSGGCAASNTDLVRSGLVTLEPTLTKALAHPPQAYERDGNLVVSGELDPSEATDGGHVDITVVGPDGAGVFDAAVLYKRPKTERGGPRGQSRGPLFPSDWRAKYSVEFPGLPPAGSVVKVRHSIGVHGNAGGT